MSGSLVGSVCLRSCFNDCNVLSTSEDGQVAVISESGVHILFCDAGSRHQQSTLHIEITKIDSDGEIFIPTTNVNHKDRAKFETVGEYTMDHTLNVVSNHSRVDKKVDAADGQTKSNAGKSKKTEVEAEKRGPRQAKWSSKNADDKGGCLLAVLWFDHRLIVYSDISKESGWTEMVDISELWKVQGKECIHKSCRSFRNDDTGFEKLRQECYMQAAVAIAWSSVYQSQRNSNLLIKVEPPSKRAKHFHATNDCASEMDYYTLLAVALKSGHVVIWKVKTPAGDDKDFNVIEVLSYDDRLPSELIFIPVNDSLVYLCQSNSNGTALLHCIYLNNADVNGQTLELWSAVDKMTITELAWCSKRNILLATKGHTVMIWHLQEMDTGHPVVIYNKSPAVSFDYSIHSMLCLPNELVLSCMDGVIYKTTLDNLVQSHDSDSFLPLEAVNMPWISKDLRINGLASSRNGIFLIVALSPATYYCHLTVRKPSKIHWVSMKTSEEVSAMSLYHIGRLQEFNDALAYLKWEWSTKCQWSEIITNFLNARHDWSMYSSYQLKLLKYLLQVQLLYWKDNSDTKGKDDLTQDIATIEEIIIYRHVQKSLDHFLQLDASTSLTTSESASLFRMVELLKTSAHQTADDSKLIKKMSKRVPSQLERCCICNSDVPFSSFERGSCQNGHTFSRCCQTLLLCSDVSYRSCIFCKKLALNKNCNGCSVWVNMDLQTNECTFCDGKLTK